MSVTLVHIPFDEQPGASVAINTANTNRSAQVVGGSFGTDGGHANLHIEAGGYARVSGSALFSLENSFTFTGWVKADATGSPTNTYLMLRFAGTDRIVTAVLGSAMTSWTLLKIEQLINGADGSISISLNGSVVQSGDYPAGWGTPVGMALYNDDVTTATGNVRWSEVLVESEVLVRPQLIGPVSFEMLTTQQPTPAVLGNSVAYSLNGLPFEQFEIYVDESLGVMDALEPKPRPTADWANEHGEAVDLSTTLFMPREITLKCWIDTVNPAQLMSRWRTFTAELYKSQTQRLQINVFDEPALVYDVYSPKGTVFNKAWRKGRMVSTFDLLLREPDPVKRVLSFVGPGTVTLTISSDNALQLHWGDGLHDSDVYGSSKEVSHTYTGTGTYYIIIAGLIEEITSLTSNATMVWPLL
ncbi:hypothetical protein [Fibrella forsythiae]|uniref:PKD domain-containing protein n=1 Tax=Fibrella forsythiae TaxID=2817061 RepID=A0ABS3JCT6_9BACT|nr:hypothetical protein [Fibrella forsythiae]MBO0947251.1 hypothetical protein [Fibrella forsythiae]